MFSPDRDDDDSFEPNRRANRINKKVEKRKRSSCNKSDEENSPSPSKPRKLSNSRNSTKTPRNSSVCNGSVASTSNTSHHALSGGKTGRSHSTPLNDIVQTKAKRSLQRQADKYDNYEHSYNDDVEELRAERENQISEQDFTIEAEKGSKSLEIVAHYLDSELTSEQLAAHLASCIELNAANKININNAFNLKLIDYMVLLLKRNDKTMKDFPTMSCSLDASTRIYACRVDSVHAGVMEIATGLATEKQKRKKSDKDLNNSNEDNQSGEDDSDDRGNNARRGKRRKTVLASSEKAISKNTIEIANWMMRKAIEPNFTALFNKARMIQSSESNLTLLKDTVKLIPEKKQMPPPSESSSLAIEITDAVTRQTPLFQCPFRFHWDHKIDVENESEVSPTETVSQESMGAQETETSGLMNEPKPLEDSIINSDSFNQLPDIPSDCDMMPDDTDCDSELPEEKPDVDKEFEVKHARKARERIDMISMVKSKSLLFTDDNDYSYLHRDVMPMIWAGPEHWKPVLRRGRPTVRVECAEKKVAKKLKKKTPDGISCDDFSMLDDIFSKKGNCTLPSKSMKNWTEEKVTLPVIKDETAQYLYRSFIRKTLFFKPLLKREKEEEDEGKVEIKYADDIDDVFEESHLRPEGIAGLDDNSDDFDAGDDGSIHDNYSDNGDFVDNLDGINEQDENNEQQTSNSTEENYLVPLPRMVECGIINYATVPKRVNMKKLKETVWSLMDIEGNKENEYRNSTSDNACTSVLFSKIYLELPKHMPKDTRNDLSPALAFLSMLHLANEKTLQLDSIDKESDTDFSIRRDN